MPGKQLDFEYDIAVSFAGENRSTVDRFVKIVEESGLRVFYDDAETSVLWGKDLYTYLHDVYKNKARYCVMFISEYYAKKRWTNHERQSAQERAFNENKEYILPVRFDDTEIPGIRGTIGYQDLRKKTIDKIAKIAIEKIQVEKGATSTPRITAKKGGGSSSKSKKVTTTVVENSGDWILLNEKFYQSQAVERTDDKQFILSIVSNDASTDSQIETLRDHRNTGKRSISFAYANDAFIVRCESVTSSYVGGSHTWKIVLIKEDISYGGGFTEMSFSDGKNTYSADDFVRMRAERILLAKSESPKEGPKGSSFNFTSSTIESFIQGSNTPIKVTASPIVQLAKVHSRSNSTVFLIKARLMTLFYLKAGDIVERVERFALGPMKNTSVHVYFQGVRRRKYSNVDPTVITIEGECPLPS